MEPIPPTDLTGHTLGDYTLLRRIGQGGMADVYLARQHALLERNVALKILKPELAGDPSYVKRFHREAQSAASLAHSNIVQIYEVSDFEGLHFIAQEYVQGGNLKQYIDRHGAVEPVMALTVLRQCALALQKAEKFNVVHRDIKPENIMLSTSGEVKVTDFGLARINDDTSQGPDQPPAQALTKIGITMGTPLYMSPEQVEGKRLDSRSDIYSLGVTAYHMLAGTPPFNGENALAIAVQQVKEEAPLLTEIRPDVPADLCQTIHRMIAKDPDQRPQDATQLLKELRKTKIDVDEDWDTLIEKLAVAGVSADGPGTTFSQSKMAATQQLQSVMKGNLRSWWRNPVTLAIGAALSLLALIAGWSAATNYPPPFPLDVAQGTQDADGPSGAVQEIPHREQVDQQYNAAYWGTYALGPDDEQRKIEFWKAVIDYFPENQATPDTVNKTKLYHHLAQSRLGEVYLAQRKLPEALEIYETLASHEGVSEHFRVTGLAGQAIVFDLMSPDQFTGGDAEREQKIRSAISEIGARFELLNETMRSALTSIRQRLQASRNGIGILLT